MSDGRVNGWMQFLGLFLISPRAQLAYALLACFGCTAHTAKDQSVENWHNGQRIVKTFPRDATVLTLFKNDPSSGEQWSTVLERVPGPTRFQWEFAGAGTPFSDHRADGNFVAHLLDSLETLQFADLPPDAPLASLGLEPPSFAIRWSVGDRTEELHIGGPGVNNGEFFAQIGSDPRPVLVEGSFLKLIREVRLDRLRQRAWSSQAPDDIDEIDVRRGGKSVFYAQRERTPRGVTWTNRGHEPLKVDAGKLIQDLLRAPIQDFVDEPVLAARAASDLTHHPDFEAVFSAREGGHLTLSVRNQESLALCSQRPHAPFRLSPGVMAALRMFSQP
jgi:hypothetical protein